MQQLVQGSRGGTGVLLLFFLNACLLLSGCGASKQELTEQWETQKQRAFQQFRDRRYDDALDSYGKTVQLAKQIDPDGLQVAITLNDMAVVYVTKNNSKNANALYEQASSILENLLAKDGFNKELMVTYMETMAGLGKIRKADGNLPAAEEFYSKGVEIGRRADSPSKLRELVYEYKSVLAAEGKSKETDALDDEFASLADSEQLPDKDNSAREQANKYINKAENAWREKDTGRADQAYQEAYRYVRQSSDPAFRADIEAKIATYLCLVHNVPAAEGALRETLQDLKAAQTAEGKMLPYLMAFGGVENQLGKFDSAANAGQLALKIAKREYPGDTLPVREAMGVFVNAMYGLHEYEQALSVMESSYAITKKLSPLDGPDMVMQTCYFANIYWAAGKHDKAQALMNEYVASLQKHPKSLNLVGRLFNDYSVVIARSPNNRDEAMMFANQAVNVLKKAPDGAPETKRATVMIKALQTRKPS